MEQDMNLPAAARDADVNTSRPIQSARYVLRLGVITDTGTSPTNPQH